MSEAYSEESYPIISCEGMIRIIQIGLKGKQSREQVLINEIK
jgi:hypothetical protein